MKYSRKVPKDGPAWSRAIAQGRDYLTPLDVEDALEAGARPTDVDLHEGHRVYLVMTCSTTDH